LAWRDELLAEANTTLQDLQRYNEHHPDPTDHASAVMDRTVELLASDRKRKLIGKINAALQRIKDGTYGYCEATGEPIGVKRLEARPIATLSIEAQELRERRKRIYGTSLAHPEA
jgi:DnaK suppressor protein